MVKYIVVCSVLFVVCASQATTPDPQDEVEAIDDTTWEYALQCTMDELLDCFEHNTQFNAIFKCYQNNTNGIKNEFLEKMVSMTTCLNEETKSTKCIRFPIPGQGHGPRKGRQADPSAAETKDKKCELRDIPKRLEQCMDHCDKFDKEKWGKHPLYTCFDKTKFMNIIIKFMTCPGFKLPPGLGK